VGIGQQKLTFGRRPDAAASPVKQAYVKLLFKPDNLYAQR
jgi:hypothetical protein